MFFSEKDDQINWNAVELDGFRDAHMDARDFHFGPNMSQEILWKSHGFYHFTNHPWQPKWHLGVEHVMDGIQLRF